MTNPTPLPADDLVERLRLPVSESMFVRKTDMMRALFSERAEAADAIDRLTRENADLKAKVAKLEEINALWQRQSREGWEAFSAMRDTINEVVPIQSAEADLLGGPEMSVACAAVAQAVVTKVTEVEARLAEYKEGVEPPDYDTIDIPPDIEEFGVRHGIPVFGSATYRNGYLAGFRAFLEKETSK